MDKITIIAEQRERTGTRYARRLRAAGRMPGVIYGHKEDPVSISVDEREMLRHLHHGIRLFSVECDGKDQTCLIKDLQFGFLGDDVVHIDLTRVDLNEEVDTQVSLNFHGDAVGLKTVGSIFRTVRDALEIHCKVSDIPSEIVVDVTDLDVGNHLAAKDIVLPDGVELSGNPNAVICRIPVVKEVSDETEADAADLLIDGEAPADGADAPAAGSDDDA